ncbi:MAG: response regulator transcription factor [Phycisphaerales bacterium]|nr:MAG: response regulator transcription factor [Phycisphaerales bacterium]
MQDEPIVFVVDDDEAVRDSLSWLIESAGLRVECFASAKEFLDAYDDDQPGCVVLDVRFPGMSGLSVQERLRSLGAMIPVIVISGHADVSTAVRAMKSGAIDFLEKPFREHVFLDRIENALRMDKEMRRARAFRSELAVRYELLTPRERETMALVVAGESNKGVARRLRVSHKTVEAHRAHVMSKMQADSLADLVRMSVVLASGADDPPGGSDDAPHGLRRPRLRHPPRR